MTTPQGDAPKRPRRPKTPRSLTQGSRKRMMSNVVGIAGELLITAGAFVFLFLGWQLWLNDIIQGNSQRDDALALSRSFGDDEPTATPAPEPSATGATPSPSAVPPEGFGEPVVSTVASVNKRFATIYVPRFGDDYVRTIAEGISASSVLRTNVGHYPDSQMPGEIGNFAIAGHRTTHGAPFNKIAELQVGDKIYVQTEDGWYTYVYRSMEYVLPTGVGVLDEVPQNGGLAATERVMTMTSCNPLLSAAERIIAYSVFESWQPTSAGPPEAVRSLVERQA